MSLLFRILKIALLVFVGITPIYAEETSNRYFQPQPAQQRTTLYGFTRAHKAFPITFEVSGKVVVIYAEVGERITDASFACLDSQFVDLDIQHNNSQISALQADLTFLEKQLNRQSKLLKKESTSITQYEDTERQFTATKHQLESLKVQKTILEERKQRHCISLPSGWRIKQRQLEAGEWINAGQPVGEVGDFRKLIVPLSVTVNEYQYLVQNKDKLELVLPEISDSVPAHIYRTYPGFDEQGHKIKIDLAIDNTEELLRGGLKAELNIYLPAAAHTYYVPESALEKRYGEYWLKTKSGDEIAVTFISLTDETNADGLRLVKISTKAIAPDQKFLLRR
ncbi:MAG: HlyD family efflux transporter periplasmic adaptor subunit [Pseudomonadales bacterium]|nr:HlyD family efflux transporter periplasmic adaptor subunit [Pseudomonadales bacterium]